MSIQFSKTLRSLGVSKKSKVLLAVSGGMDSMVLLHLAHRSGYKCSVAHVNYNLRGSDSNADEVLVKAACAKFDIPFFSKHAPIDKSNMADGLQLEARKIRYAFFDKIMIGEKIDFLFTAHHADDRLETFFINLSRGAGIKGLKSIPEKNGKTIRPLLHLRKPDLRTYAEEYQLKWREDKSNETDYYLRNKIRHGIASQFDGLSKKAVANANLSMDFLTEADSYFKAEAKKFMAGLLSDKELIVLKMNEWQNLFERKPLHKYVFEKLGFRSDQLKLLETLIDSESGKQVQGKYYTVYKDRNRLILEPVSHFGQVPIQLEKYEGNLDNPFFFEWEKLADKPPVNLKKQHHAYLNADKLVFPLTVRKWQNGDSFQPFGMNGFKKLSDYFIDIKLSVPEKNKVFVLLSQNEICWVIGHRIDDRFKLNGTCDVLHFKTKKDR